MPLRILIVIPSAAGERSGNQVTARRWSRMLRSLGHRVTITDAFRDQRCDLLIALHAHRSADSALRFARQRPGSPLVVGLSGTDLYRDLERSKTGNKALEAADRIVLLQPHGVARLAKRLHRRCRVIYQSVVPLRRRPAKVTRWWQVAVVGHLRPVKDPFQAVRAVRGLPRGSRIRVVQLGKALTPAMRARAEREMRLDAPRYRWLGSRPHWQVMRTLARSRLMVLSSHMEGGANVIGESIVAGTPVVSTRISGSIGLLGEDYPGFFEVGDTSGLTALLARAESDRGFYSQLATACRAREGLFTANRERQAWEDLVQELVPGSAPAAGQ